MKQVFKCEYCRFIGTKKEVKDHEEVCINNPAVKCCQNCRYARENPYTISFGFDTAATKYMCMYRAYINNSNVLYTGDPIPEENICEHYERGTPQRIIPL